MSPLQSAAGRGTPAALILIVCFAAGCASDDRPSRGGRDRPPRIQAIPTLSGQETFFDARITTEVRIGPMAGFDPSGKGEAGGNREGRPPRGGPGGGPGGSGGGFSMGGGGMGGGGMGGMGPPPGGGPPGMGPGGEDGRPQPQMRPPMAMGAPPVAIHLRFTNTGTTPADLQIVDFLSPLGNFVVNPSRLRLEPGQSLEVEPMASRLAGEVTSGEISLSLRLDDRKETKTVTLQPEAPQPPPASP